MLSVHPPKKEPITYVNKYGDRIEEGDTFVYELSKYKYSKVDKHTIIELVDNKKVKSDKEIASKHEYTYFPNKKKWTSMEELCIVMLVAPKQFIYNNHFPIWELKKKEHGKGKVSNKRVRRL